MDNDAIEKMIRKCEERTKDLPAWIPALTEKRRKQFQEEYDRCEADRLHDPQRWHCWCHSHD